MWRLAELCDEDRVPLSSQEGATLLFGHCAPLNEPVVAHGPFVMNTAAEIQAAFRDHQMGGSAILRRWRGGDATSPNRSS